MTCDSIATFIPLYYYGELTPEEEDGVEEHIHQCRDWARAMEQQRVLAAALDRRDMQVPPLLLEDCRADLIATGHGGASQLTTPVKNSVKEGPLRLVLVAIA